MKKSTIVLILSCIAAVFLLIVGLLLVQIKTVNGDEVAVKETWDAGVLNEVFPPKTYFLFPGFSQKMYPYKISQQVYVMNDDPNDANDGRAKDSYLVQSREGQDMRLSLAVQWRRDPSKVVQLHKTVGSIENGIEEKILRPVLMKVVKDEATSMLALDAYSGEGLVKLQNNILTKLRDANGELYQRGIIVDNFVIQHNGLDPKYVEQIKEKQVAVQERLKNDEQTRAAEAAAKKAKAVAQAGYETAVVLAEQNKQVGILEAERNAQQQVLAAEAEKKKLVLWAEGEAESGKLRGQGILAVGQSEAEIIKIKMLAYSGIGAENYVKMEVAKSMAEAYKGIKGYLPSDMNINLLSENYAKGVSLLVNPDPISKK